MKKMVMVLMSSFMLLTVIAPLATQALDMSAGIVTWYAWWDFPEEEYENIETDPDFVYGPSVSFNLNDSWSLTSVFLYSHFEAEGTYSYYHVLNPTDPILPLKYNIDRFDSDTAVNYRINSYFKLYFGIKFTGYFYDFTSHPYTYAMEVDHWVLGPGAGLSMALPLGWNFSITGNAGGLCLMGVEKYSGSGSDSLDVRDYGFNTGLSLVYYIEPASTAISLGGRYQYLRIRYDDGFVNTSKFYGVTLSASYLFSL